MNKKKSSRFFLFCLAAAFFNFPLSGACPLSAQELSGAEADIFIQNMAGTLKTKKSMRVDFKQERHLSVFLEPLVSKGSCFFQDPKRMRWEIEEPYRSLLIFNDNRVAKYDFEQGTPRRLTLGSEDVIREVLVQIMDWMKGDFRNSAEVYNIRIYKNENIRLRLIPRSSGLLENIQFIELHIDPLTKQITQVVIRENETDFVRIGFSNERNNIELEAQLFDLKNPLIRNGGAGR